MIICLFSRCNSNKQTTDTNKLVSDRKQYKSVELTSLVSNPQMYNGKQVKVKGFLKLAFEGNIIYSRKQEYEQRIDSNSLWVDISRKQMDSTYRSYNKSNVIIDGVFDMTNKGHMGGFKGAITNITKIELIK